MAASKTGPCCPRDPAERFWEKVDKTDGCWLWTGAVSGKYGSFRVKVGEAPMAHDFAYELLIGPVLSGKELDHLPTCPKICVNPAHLNLVSRKENQENRSGPNANSTSGVRGVGFDRSRGKWTVIVTHHGKSYHGGRFPLDKLAEAEVAAIALRNKLFTNNTLDKVSVDG